MGFLAPVFSLFQKKDEDDTIDFQARLWFRSVFGVKPFWGTCYRRQWVERKKIFVDFFTVFFWNFIIFFILLFGQENFLRIIFFCYMAFLNVQRENLKWSLFLSPNIFFLHFYTILAYINKKLWTLPLTARSRLIPCLILSF